MAQLQANRTLSGSFASVWVDGALIAELESITVKVKLQRERVQLGMDVDSKITGYSGEGTMKLKQVYTRFYEVLDEARRGVDKRCTITTALKDPDSVDGQEERYAIAGVAFTELPFINYKIGEVNGQSLPFTFRPSELKSLDAIGVGGDGELVPVDALRADLAVRVATGLAEDAVELLHAAPHAVLLRVERG